MTQPTNGTVYKVLAGFLAGIVVTGVSWIVQWSMIARTLPSREEMHEYVQKGSPYVLEKPYYSEKIKELDARDNDIKSDLNAIRQEFVEMKKDIEDMKAALRMHRIESLKHYERQEQQMEKPH